MYTADLSVDFKIQECDHRSASGENLSTGDETWSMTAGKRCDPRRDTASWATMKWEPSTNWVVCNNGNWSPSAPSFIIHLSLLGPLAGGRYWWVIGGREEATRLFFFFCLSALKSFSASSCVSSLFPAPSEQAFPDSSCYHLTLTFETLEYHFSLCFSSLGKVVAF